MNEHNFINIGGKETKLKNYLFIITETLRDRNIVAQLFIGTFDVNISQKGIYMREISSSLVAPSEFFSQLLFIFPLSLSLSLGRLYIKVII